MMKFIFPLGADPGLKSLASASASPELIIFLAGVYGRLKKKEHPGKATGIVSEFFKT